MVSILECEVKTWCPINVETSEQRRKHVYSSAMRKSKNHENILDLATC